MISVLSVDGEPELLAACRAFLEKSGDIRVTTAGSGLEGLQRLAERSFDVVVYDYTMDGIDGIGLLLKVRQRHPQIPIILFAGGGSEETATRVFNKGMDYYIRKGGDPILQFGNLEKQIREAARHNIDRNHASLPDYRELLKARRSLEELQAAYQELHATDSALRENFRSLTTEQAVLKDAGGKYRFLFESGPDAVLLIDDNSGTIIDANVATTLLYGYSREEILGKNLQDLLAEPGQSAGNNWSDSDRSEFLFLQNQKRKGGAVFPAEVALRKGIWNGRSACIIAVRDNTCRCQDGNSREDHIERAVRYQKALVQLATEDAPTLRISLQRITETGAVFLSADRVGIWFLSRDGQSLICSDLYVRNSGMHSREEAFSWRDHRLFISLLQEKRAIFVPDALHDDCTRELAAPYLGSRDIVSLLDIPIRSGKTVVGMISFEQVGTIRNWEIEDQDFAIALADYTAIVLEQARRRLAEKDFRRSERKYHEVVERANDGIVIIQDGHLKFVNPRAAGIIGYIPEELLESPFSDYIAHAERGTVLERYRQRITGARIPSIYNTVLVRKDGTPVEVEVNAGVMELDGKLSDLVFIRDITDRKRSEQALLLANQKLNLLSSITRHDILNKLTVVIGYLELTKMAHDREELDAFIKKMDDTLRIVEDQVQFTRDYQDLGVKEPEWQDISSTFDAAVSQLDPGNVRIINRAGGLSLYSDPLLGKVLYNIVDNALKYGETLTEIMISYRIEDDKVVLRLEDNGVGIPVKDKARIFEKGFGHNTGLGLFLAKEILSLTGIEIMETGFPSKGARFEIHVPAGRFKIGK